MERLQRRAGDPFNAFHGAPRPSSVRMRIAVEQREQPFARHRRRIVLVLTNHRHDFAAPRFDFRIGKRRMHDDVRERGERRAEIFDQTGADERQRVAVDRNRERDAAILEPVGNFLGGVRRGSAIDRPRDEMRNAVLRWRIEDRPRLERGVDGHGRRGARMLRDDAGAVVQHRSQRRQGVVALLSGGHETIGSNQPTVRLVGVRHRPAASPTCCSVTASMLSRSEGTRRHVAIVSK